MENTNLSPKDTRIEIRHVVMPHQANPNGNLFGGVILSWIDLAAAIVAEKYTRTTVATVFMDSVTFKEPMRVGNHALIEAKVQYVGSSSLVIRVLVWNENPRKRSSSLAAKTDLTFVALDENNRPVNISPLKLETEEDKKVFNEIIATCNCHHPNGVGLPLRFFTKNNNRKLSIPYFFYSSH